MPRTILTGIAVLFLVTGIVHAEEIAGEGGLPEGYGGKWCLVAERHDWANERTYDLWKKGPCVDQIITTVNSIRKKGHKCKFDRTEKAMLYLHYVHYVCDNGKSGSAAYEIDRDKKDETKAILYIWRIKEEEWKETAACVYMQECR
jgi:hypothetical protein